MKRVLLVNKAKDLCHKRPCFEIDCGSQIATDMPVMSLHLIVGQDANCCECSGYQSLRNGMLPCLDGAPHSEQVA